MADVFPPLPTGYPFPELEREILEYWDKQDVFQKTLEKTNDGPPFVFYEGPPTANNKPHVGHVVTRVVKDLFPRYKTMRGFHVSRKAGWDTHGLPVEIEVEKTLGFSGKQDIEAYGVERFNRTCLESVHRYEKQWREMTRRVGFWVDLEDAYFTYSNKYIESVWWALGELFQQDLLEKGHKIQPYCARCGTTLSSHEVAQNYQEADDPSIWTIFRILPGQSRQSIEGEDIDLGGVGLVGWTTTPWTTLANAAVAVHEDLIYRLIENPAREGERLLIGDNLEKPVPLHFEVNGELQKLDLRESAAIARFKGNQLATDLRYERLFTFFEPGTTGRVVLGRYVTSSEGTGLVHTAPPFGEDDYETGLTYQLPMMMAVDAGGRIVAGAGPFSGLSFKEADRPIIKDLKERGLLLHSERYKHNYPFCWRCDQPLLYYASESWFVRTTERKNELVSSNQSEIHWSPEHVGVGRFGNWLETLVDWALSRKRYWGTPLPIWECDQCGTPQAIRSYAELFQQAGRELPDDPYDREQFDPHRPYVDRDHQTDPFVWDCVDCEQGQMGRVSDVIDAWFDSGSMPFAQHHFTGKGTEKFDPEKGIGFPADFISEAVDQTRGWFYTLHALGVLLFGSAAYKNCIVLGHISDDTGRKMSKRLGNVVDPMEVLAETGADALRWYFYISNPEVNSRFSARLVREAAQKFLIPLWNAASFLTIYANLDQWRPGARSIPFRDRPALDRWILLRLERVVRVVSESLDSYAIVGAAREIEQFVDELTNWYIRRSRDRFWAPASGDSPDKESAYQTLYGVFTKLIRIVAPFTPFVAEVLHRQFLLGSVEGASTSVHLETWPESEVQHDEPELEDAMAAVLRIVGLGRAARNEHQLKTRQPLATVTIISADDSTQGLIKPYLEIIRDELNVREVLWAKNRSEFVHHDVRPHFPKCGPRFGKKMKDVQRALAATDGDELAAALERDGKIRIELGSEAVFLVAEEVEVRLVEKEGMATQGDQGFLVALETELSAELIDEGRAREIVHRIQARRKDLDLDYADRITVSYFADPEIERALETHRAWVSGETLTVEWQLNSNSNDLVSRPIDGMDFSFSIAATS